MGRKKEFEERINLPLTSEMLAEMDSLLRNGEYRLDLIREAIEIELKRRRRAGKAKSD